ncbi:hypothetical protein HID58_051519 [Brassica napus]|uniref:Uncharacterized protein n=1 Tax=Brassica napus TaxID=3708 RepID=A0ABQ8AAJ8_BRANA|nr:hypothetical protein HID58_051519 [Brassica napus]
MRDHQSYVTSCVIRSQVVSFVCFDVARLIVTSKSFDTSASDTPRHDFSQPCIAKLNCVALRHRKPLPFFINSWYIRYCICGLASQHIRYLLRSQQDVGLRPYEGRGSIQLGVEIGLGKSHRVFFFHPSPDSLFSAAIVLAIASPEISKTNRHPQSICCLIDASPPIQTQTRYMILLSLTICILRFWDPSWRKLLRRFQGRIDIPNRSAASSTLLRRFKPKRVIHGT